MTAAAGTAAEFWEEKPFSAWSDKDVNRLLNDSPWAQRTSVPMPRSPRESADIPTGGRGGGDDSTVGRSMPVAVPQIKLTVQWRSALPIRQALARNQFGADAAKIPADIRDSFERDEPAYVVSVLGLPVQFAHKTGDIKAVTVLQRPGKPPIPPNEAGAQQSGPLVSLIFVFPRTEAITLDDREVEFVTRLDQFEIRRKFKLKEMVIGGQLKL
jgi:hypothetical protein